MYSISQEDLTIILNQSAAPQTAKIKVEVLDGNRIIGAINGVVSGSMSISAESDVRRTCNLTVCPTIVEKLKLSEDSLLWLNKDIRLSVGIYNVWTKTYKFYAMGTYVYTDTSGTYDGTTNQLTINCADFMKKLDGTKNGQLGQLSIVYAAYEEDEETGEVISYNHIRDAVITTIEQLAGIKNYRVDDIGEYKAMPDYNPDWERYREENVVWNTIPYDQEFSCGCSVLSILTTFRDLYPNYEMFFDENNVFVCQMVPSCYEDDIYLHNEFIQRILISENTSVDMTTVRNVCEVWGKVIETDFYADKSTYSGNVYSCTIEGFIAKDDDKGPQYYNGDIISIMIGDTNESSPSININNIGNVPIYNENTELPLGAGEMEANNVYSFKISKKRENKQDILKCYLLGQWQPHALSVLTDGTVGENVTLTKTTVVSVDEDGKYKNVFEDVIVPKYSEEYFKLKYNVTAVDMTVIPNSPFTVQKLSEILEVKTGGEFENITSNSLAQSRAHWENWKNCRLTDNITITTALALFADVNVLVTYKPSDCNEIRKYIVKSVSHDFSGFTTSWQMMRFYPLYEPIDEKAGTHERLGNYTHEYLNRYTHEQLEKMG